MFVYVTSHQELGTLKGAKAKKPDAPVAIAVKQQASPAPSGSDSEDDDDEVRCTWHDSFSAQLALGSFHFALIARQLLSNSHPVISLRRARSGALGARRQATSARHQQSASQCVICVCVDITRMECLSTQTSFKCDSHVTQEAVSCTNRGQRRRAERLAPAFCIDTAAACQAPAARCCQEDQEHDNQ